MPPFAARLARVDAAVDREHGEKTRIVPLAKGEFLAGGADPDRPPYVAIGVVDINPQVVRHRLGTGSSVMEHADVAGNVVEVSYTVSRLGDRARWPRRGDRIERLNDDETPNVAVATLLVSLAEFDGMSRLLCRCQPEPGG